MFEETQEDHNGMAAVLKVAAVMGILENRQRYHQSRSDESTHHHEVSRVLNEILGEIDFLMTPIGGPIH